MVNGALRAWIEIQGDRIIAAFVGADESRRAPATRVCTSRTEAQHWIEAEAAALGLPVTWAGEGA